MFLPPNIHQFQIKSKVTKNTIKSTKEMAAWSAENATRAYLQVLNSTKPTEPNAAEFISALAAGSGARLIIEARSTPAGPATLALAAAAQQAPGGKVVCILADPTHLEPSIQTTHGLGHIYNPNLVEFLVGDAANLLMKDYRGGADFVLVDCELEGAFEAARVSGGGLVVGSNAIKYCNKSNAGSLLPIGNGLRVCRVTEQEEKAKKSQWVKRVDECTGEEHVYRITAAKRKWIRA